MTSKHKIVNLTLKTIVIYSWQLYCQNRNSALSVFDSSRYIISYFSHLGPWVFPYQIFFCLFICFQVEYNSYRCLFSWHLFQLHCQRKSRHLLLQVQAPCPYFQSVPFFEAFTPLLLGSSSNQVLPGTELCSGSQNSLAPGICALLSAVLSLTLQCPVFLLPSR